MTIESLQFILEANQAVIIAASALIVAVMSAVTLFVFLVKALRG